MPGRLFLSPLQRVERGALALAFGVTGALWCPSVGAEETAPELESPAVEESVPTEGAEGEASDSAPNSEGASESALSEEARPELLDENRVLEARERPTREEMLDSLHAGDSKSPPPKETVAQAPQDERPQEAAVEDEEKPLWKDNIVYDYIETVFGYPDDPNEPRFIAYPVVGFAPETSWEFGLAGLYVYYAKDNPKNRLSELSAFGFVTLEGQYGLHLEHALYTDQDDWFFLGTGHFQSFPLQYYGIGPDTDPDPLAYVDENSILIRERVLKKIFPSFYVGAEFQFDLLRNLKFNWRDGVEPELPNGGEGSINASAGFGLVYDNRHNVLNVREGFFTEIAFLHSNQAWGSDFNFSDIEADARYFHPINERDTLAVQAFGRFTFGDVPFNELSTLGGPNLLRGYYLGRFRDNHFIGSQLEYRFLPFPFSHPFLRRFGGSLFAGTGTVFSGSEGPALEDFVVAGGGGLRFLLFPEKDIYTRADLAFTKEGSGFYLIIGEAF